MAAAPLALLPAQGGVFFDEAAHRYWFWSEDRYCWEEVRSVSQVLTISGEKAFDWTLWQRSLERKGMTPHEATEYRRLHSNHRASVGTDFHGLVRAELLGEPYHPHHAEALLLLTVWRREFLPRIEQVLICEAPLISKALFFAGTPDLVAVVDGRLLVVDWKTKASEAKARVDASWPLQLTAYAMLVREIYGIAVDGTANLMIWPEGCRLVPNNRADMAVPARRFCAALMRHHQEAAKDHLGYREAMSGAAMQYLVAANVAKCSALA